MLHYKNPLTSLNRCYCYCFNGVGNALNEIVDCPSVREFIFRIRNDVFCILYELFSKFSVTISFNVEFIYNIKVKKKESSNYYRIVLNGIVK